MNYDRPSIPVSFKPFEVTLISTIPFRMQYCFLFTILAGSHRKFQGLPLAFHNIIALTNRSRNWGEVSANCCVHKHPLGHLKVMWDVEQFFVFLTCSMTWPVVVLSWVYASSISHKHFQNTIWGIVPSQLRITILEPSPSWVHRT